ncbi:murein hydrolase activator EnvC [Roseivirga sp. E12]|uniref:murein hydrolase activator EnvC family protein n=1 Tax=Roseivirga sp. E12 TaxID=2819237 RepID=UPI001ABC095A|nr:peptidoglycan DD-metalloendopeptidase family protein [Roseivirga sp. E12]MBO3700806.1 peptidoglycan DD-metalloendopeptidase family protein [Roseivirga sp. E12]
MSGSRIITLLVLLILAFDLSQAQTERQRLEKQKQEIQDRILETQKILSQTADKKNNSLGRLRALNNQIRSRASLVNAIKGEVSLLDEEIAEDQSIIDAMGKDLLNLKDEYGQMIYATQKTSSGFNHLTFLFASSTFNQLFMRMKYIKQYGEARKKQVEQIEIVQESLNQQITEIEIQKSSKQSLLNEELSENQKLSNLQSEQRSLVTRLEQQENKIRQDLARQRASEKELGDRIDAIIEAERLAALASSIDMSDINKAFEGEKGRLPWPVDQGFVSSKYGQHRHPTLKTVMLTNKGIDIQTTKDARVKAVFPGKVSAIMSIPGQGNTVLIQHGEYFTAYSKLKAVVVKKGQQVQGQQILGQVITDNNDVSEVKFKVFDQKTNVNPETWLERKIN